MTCNVVITQLVIQFQDKLSNVVDGNIQLVVVRRELPKQVLGNLAYCCSEFWNCGCLFLHLRQGHVFDIEVGKVSLRNIHSLALFSNIEVNPRLDEKNEWGFIVEIKLNKLEQYNAKVSTDWSIVPKCQGRPTLDDLAFKFEYIHPYLDGVKYPRNKTFHSRCFNSGKPSLVFTGGPGAEENFTRQSEITYGLVLEKIITQNESTNISQNGQRQLPNGGISADGNPITLSGTGIDELGFFQANITWDNTKLVNGAIVGLFVGSEFTFFNRHQLTYTKFLQLKPVEGVDKPPPPVLVLHGHYGGCIADLPSYDAFKLGGPYCVRGYNKGELGACMNILEKGRETAFPRGDGSKAHNERAAFLADIVLARSHIKDKEGSKLSTNGDGIPAYSIVDAVSASVHRRSAAEVRSTSDDMPKFLL
ncbi:hypothetical protein MKX03_012756 [Papaver bracteatum]|nr:hypothetical protein MKX03_012756 [Papaver bracteatum]